MSTINEVTGKRYGIETALGRAYLFVGDQELMATVPEENNPVQAETRALLECVCRLASKAMGNGLSLADVAEQMEKSGTGRSTILTEVAGKVREYLGGEKKSAPPV